MSPTPQRRPELTSDEMHRLRWLLGGLLTLLAAGTVVYMDVDAWLLMLATAATTLATLIWPTLPARVPPLAHTLAFPAIVSFFAVDLWLKTEVLPAMVRLDMLLLLYRGLNYRQRRDDLQIIVLGLFLIVVAGVLTVSLVFAVHILIYAGCALALLLVVTLSDATSGAGPRPAPVGEAPAWARHGRWLPLLRRIRQALDWRVVGLGLTLFAGVVGVSTLLFLLIPRFQLESSMFLDRIISKKAKSGFSDSIRVGDVTDIQQDNSVALSVDVTDQAQIPASPYWRMLVLDVYDAGTFKFSTRLRERSFEPSRTGTGLKGNARPRLGEPVYWTFFMESGVSRFLPLVGHFEGLVFRESQNFSYAPQLAVLALREEPVSMTAYRVEGFDTSPALPDARFAEIWRGRTEESPRLPLQLWLPVFPRSTDLATLRRAVTEATGGEALPAPEFSRRAIDWLRRNHTYSLSPVVPPGDGDPLIKWMTSREVGHCELFAGSFVLLARAAGIPARIVIGFRGGSWNGYSNNFTIRNSDAHAWAEIFDEKSGSWLRADPLAAPTGSHAQADDVRRETAMALRMDLSWKARLDSLRVFWYRRIVSFDQASQVETFKAVKEATQSSGKRLREAITGLRESVRDWLAQPWDLKRIATWTGVLIAGAGLGWLWREFGRDWWRARPRRNGRREDPVRREAGRWLRKLELEIETGDRNPSKTGERKPEAGEGTLSGEVTEKGMRSARDRASVGDFPVSGFRSPVLGEVRMELQRLRYGAIGSWPAPDRVFRRARKALRDARRAERLTRS